MNIYDFNFKDFDKNSYQENLEYLTSLVKEHGGLDNQQLEDAANYGAAGGFSGFTYIVDCEKFYNRNEELIYYFLAEDCEALGENNIDSMVSTFGRADLLDSAQGRKVLLSWYALELAGRFVLDIYDMVAIQ